MIYERGAQASTDTCCCGNEFAIGAGAEGRVTTAPGFETQIERFESPWDELLPAVWAIGPSVHAAEHEHAEHEHAEHAAHGSPASSAPMDSAADPVCGMTVDPATARGKGLHSSYQERDYFFCGKGCKLEFDDDPERYLDPAYQPSM
ncbi:MAG: YHS domain-containing protein [Chloroflexota bacterium]|nr:YHS domain-containing protein [Chloroflexota bacterium]